MKEEQVPAWVEVLRPRSDEEAQRAQRHARDFRLRMQLVNGERPVTENQTQQIGTLINTNSARLHEDYVIGGVA